MPKSWHGGGVYGAFQASQIVPNMAPLLLPLSNIITSINIRPPNRSEVVRKAKAMTVVIGRALKQSILIREGRMRFTRTLTPALILLLFPHTKLLLNQQIKSRAYDLIDLLLWK